MRGYKHQLPGSGLETWSKNVELVRKDVECVFGIPKKCFLLLKHLIRFHDPIQIQSRAFVVTCCVLHNFLLDFDMYDDWNMDESRIDVEYVILEGSAALRAASSRNCHVVAGGVRSNVRAGYLNDNESVQPEDEDAAIAEYKSKSAIPPSQGAGSDRSL